MTNFALSHILHSHCGTIVNISTVVMLGFWLCQFNTGSLAWGLCLSAMTIFLFGCSNLIYVIYVTVSEVHVLNLVGCCLRLFKNGRSGVLLYVSVSLILSLILACQHGA